MIGLPNFDLTNQSGKQKFVEYVVGLMRNEIIVFTASYNDFEDESRSSLPDGLLVNNHRIGLNVNKPVAGDVTPGTYYTSTDVAGGTTYRSDGIDWVAVAAGVTPGNLTGDVTSVGLATSIAPNVIVDADVNVSAAIAYSKLNLALSIVNADVNASAAISYSKLNLNNSIVSGDIVSLVWSKITSTPTTLSGYGITDAVNSVTTRTANTVFSGPTTGVAVAPTFRALVAADIPTLTLAKISDAGTAAAKNIPASGNASATEVVYGSDTRLTTAAANQVMYKNSSNVAVGNATFTFDTSALYVPYLKVNTASGDEGGQIDLIKSVTNTTLSAGVSIDVYRDKFRIYESGGTNRGYYLDMTEGLASGASQIVSKDTSGNFTAGTITAALTGTASTATALITNSVLTAPAEVFATRAAMTGTVNYDVSTQAVLYANANATANWTLNVRASSSVSLNTLLGVNQAITITLINQTGTTAYYQTAMQIDSTSVTPKWVNGSAPAAGNASSNDVYTFTILKTASATYTVFASLVRWA